MRRYRPLSLFVLASLTLSPVACSSGSDSSDGGDTTTTTTPETTEPPEVSLVEAELDLEEVSTIEDATGQAWASTPFDDEWLAAGYDFGEEAAFVLTSDDGEEWEALDVEGLGDVYLLDLVEFDGGLVGVGDNGLESSPTPMVWLSDDGERWEEVELDEAADLGAPVGDETDADEDSGSDGQPTAPGSLIRVVSDGDDGLIAFGFAGAPGDDEFAAWTSDDGEEWERLDVSFPDADGTPFVFDVLPDGEGGYVAAGDVLGDSTLATIWRSGDGEDWEVLGEIHPEDDDADTTIRHLVTTDRGWVAVGSDTSRGEPGPMVWLSDDGERWDARGDLAPRGANTIDLVFVADDTILLISSSEEEGVTADVLEVWELAEG